MQSLEVLFSASFRDRVFPHRADEIDERGLQRTRLELYTNFTDGQEVELVNETVSRTSIQTWFGLVAATIVGLMMIGSVAGLIWQATAPPNKRASSVKLPGDLHVLEFLKDGRLIYGQAGGLQVSSNGGQTWGAPTRQGDVTAIAEWNARLYVAGHNLWQRSDDGGRTWKPMGFKNLPSKDIHGLTITDNGWMFVNLVGYGLWRSTDRGTSWQILNTGFPDSDALASGPGSPPILYSRSGARGLMRSEDGGLTWQRTSAENGPIGSALSVHTPSGHIYSSGPDNPFRSTDGGRTWQPLAALKSVALIAVNPKDESQIVAVTLEGWVFRSDDGGASWQ